MVHYFYFFIISIALICAIARTIVDIFKNHYVVDALILLLLVVALILNLSNHMYYF